MDLCKIVKVSHFFLSPIFNEKLFYMFYTDYWPLVKQDISDDIAPPPSFTVIKVYFRHLLFRHGNGTKGKAEVMIN